ncbi:3-hydroxyisobutyrate dehydrogenase [Shimia gijangensis]|uniref:3-hydroxyisobutyrate dehydrogenase n=1 Tax=Shimia gijangensis TaxID=1470563 RepID=A0A1M6AXK8_9RHOB|nr:NAD(P)-binding domain-containing protein [Shimia gijangensis]SHI41058.1 3-hydroxyisobutyrate dehydrogenase [Shimia gijangensis]
MADIAFIGLGNMGLVLAKTAAKAGFDTVVWNRTADKAKPLQELGLIVAAGPKEAILTSPVIVVCVYDYEAADEILRQVGCAEALEGRVLVQLTTATPRTAKATHDWALQQGIFYLDGEIIAYPSDIGSDAARILVSGDEKALVTAAPLLRAFAPEIEYLGSDPSKASALNLATLSASLGRIIGTLNGAAICEAANIPLDQFYKNITKDADQDSDALIKSLKKIASGDLETAEATVEVWAGTSDYMTEFAVEAGYSPEISEFMRKLFDKAIKKGFGNHDVGALINILRS